MPSRRSWSSDLLLNEPSLHARFHVATEFAYGYAEAITIILDRFVAATAQ